MSITQFAPLLLSPPCGLLLDTHHGHLTLYILSLLIQLLAHLLLYFTNLSPFIGALLLGLRYVLGVNAIWALIPIVVDRKLLGMAYGALLMSVNLSSAVCPFAVVGVQNDLGGVEGVRW
ncbi:hypothetical protein HDV00_011742 [Rhizophlyctis rosea]|nr:hypothetical protein HDV00_011742 [Rhizophlyctis rosea]